MTEPNSNDPGRPAYGGEGYPPDPYAPTDPYAPQTSQDDPYAPTAPYGALTFGSPGAPTEAIVYGETT